MDEVSQKVQTFSWKISTRDVMYNTINIIHTGVHYKRKLLKNKS